jgi:uncharacterized protein (DUF924 family)
VTADILPREILEFWFGTPPQVEREAWFRKDPAFDTQVRMRFEHAIEHAIAGGHRKWESSAEGALARILLLDQFTRNAFRDTPRAFAGDVEALAAARRAVQHGFDRMLLPLQRQFIYLPYEHAESAAAQDESLALFGALAAETRSPDKLEWAQKHAAIVRRFGRYPHRNAIVGRVSTPEEIAFLREPGSRF